jgi:hypothetical protein
MQLAGMHEGRGTRPDHHCLSIDGDGKVAFHHQKKLLVLMLMWRVRRAPRRERRLMNLKMIAGMCHAIQDWPRLILPVCPYRQLIVGLGKRLEGQSVRKSRRCGQRWNSQKERASS